jgi:sugar lactone lactonase YvrE
MMQISRVGDFTLGWGESLLWDDRRDRLYFVDCATQCLHWLENATGELQTFHMTSMPAGIVPTDDGRLVAALDDGLYVVDPDARIVDRLSPYPEGLGARANDACADLSGNLITGTLNLAPSEGSSWQYSLTHGWRLLDPDIANTNGPTAFDVDGRSRLVIGDTSAQYFVYDYDADAGTVGPRAVFGDVTDIDGSPDGATLDADGGLWCALFGGAQLARFTADGLDRTLPVPAANPTDVTFAGPALDRLYVTSIGGEGEMDGALLVIDDLATTGRVEPRFAF